MAPAFLPPSAAGAWAVLMLFLIPVGGGIPGGVLLARDKGIGWPMMLVLYFISDVILAFIFEPMLKLMSAGAKRVPFLARWADAMRAMSRKSAESYGSAAGPLALIGVSFLIDPMTGRTAAAAAGHGFVSGWAIAIAGDMMYFAVLMISTLWLNSVIGNANVTMVLMLALMFLLPPLVKRWRGRGVKG